MAIQTSTFRDTPYWLNFIFSGQMFSWYYKFTIAGGATQYIEVRPDPNGRLIHEIYRAVNVLGGGPYDLIEYEDPTFDAGTTEVPTLNIDRRSAKTSTTTIYSDPTNVSGGTQIREDFITSTTQGNRQGTGTLGNAGFERILNPNSTYIIAITNDGSEEGEVLINTIFYESGN